MHFNSRILEWQGVASPDSSPHFFPPERQISPMINMKNPGMSPIPVRQRTMPITQSNVPANLSELMMSLPRKKRDSSIFLVVIASVNNRCVPFFRQPMF